MSARLFTKLYFILLIVLTVFIFVRCGTTPQLSKEVCEYTDVICDFSDVICESYPESCWYINIVCINVNILCDTTSTGKEREAATEMLRLNNKLFNAQMRELK